MARIRTVAPEDATGGLKKFYDDSIRRAGKVYHIVRLHSLRPDILRGFLGLYMTLMLKPGALARWQKEALAVVTSKTNECHY